MEPAIQEALGAVTYGLEGLSPLGAPTDATQIRVRGKSGVAEGIASRAEQGAPLVGTKRMVVRSPRVWVGHGKRDGRSLLLVPLYDQGQVSGLGLVHVRFKTEVDQRTRVRALKAVGRYEDLKCTVQEMDLDWDDALLGDFQLEELLTESAERLGEAIRARAEVAAGEGGQG